MPPRPFRVIGRSLVSLAQQPRLRASLLRFATVGAAFLRMPPCSPVPLLLCQAVFSLAQQPRRPCARHCFDLLPLVLRFCAYHRVLQRLSCFVGRSLASSLLLSSLAALARVTALICYISRRASAHATVFSSTCLCQAIPGLFILAQQPRRACARRCFDSLPLVLRFCARHRVLSAHPALSGGLLSYSAASPPLRAQLLRSATVGAALLRMPPRSQHMSCFVGRSLASSLLLSSLAALARVTALICCRWRSASVRMPPCSPGPSCFARRSPASSFLLSGHAAPTRVTALICYIWRCAFARATAFSAPVSSRAALARVTASNCYRWLCAYAHPQRSQRPSCFVRRSSLLLSSLAALARVTLLRFATVGAALLRICHRVLQCLSCFVGRSLASSLLLSSHAAPARVTVL